MLRCPALQHACEACLLKPSGPATAVATVAPTCQPAPRPTPRPRPLPRAAVVTVKTCLELKSEVDKYRTLALAATRLKPAAAKIIVLACSGNFSCADPSKVEGSQDITLKMAGAGSLTIQAEGGCTTGAARPRVYGGLDTLPTELFYAGVADPTNAGDKGNSASLTLTNLIVDGLVNPADGSGPYRLRGCVNAVRAAGIVASGTDFVNCYGVNDYGGGCVSLEDSPFAMSNGKMDNCWTSGSGGGLRAEVNTALTRFITLTGVTISNNTANSNRGGALHLVKANNVSLSFTCSSCKITNNKAYRCSILFTERTDEGINDDTGDSMPGAVLAIDWGTGATMTGARPRAGGRLGLGRAVCTASPVHSLYVLQQHPRPPYNTALTYPTRHTAGNKETATPATPALAMCGMADITLPNPKLFVRTTMKNLPSGFKFVAATSPKAEYADYTV